MPRDLGRGRILCPPALAPNIGAERAVSRIGRKTGELPGKSLIFRVFIGAQRSPEENRDDARADIGKS